MAELRQCILGLTCKLAQTVRQSGELIVTQVQFLQQGEATQATGQVFQMVVRQVLKEGKQEEI